MITNRCIHAAATAPYERYMTTNRSIHAAAAAPYERYMTTNRGIHAAAAHPKHVAFVFQGTTQMCSIVRRSNLTPYVKMGRATTFFLALWQNKLTISSGVRVRAPKKPKFFPFFFGILVSYCFLNFWFAGRCASSAIALIPSVSWCVRLRLRWWPRESELERRTARNNTLVFTHSLCVPCTDSRPHLIPRSTIHNVPIVYIACTPCRPVMPFQTRTAAVLPGLHGRSTVTASVLFYCIEWAATSPCVCVLLYRSNESVCAGRPTLRLFVLFFIVLWLRAPIPRAACVRDDMSNLRVCYLPLCRCFLLTLLWRTAALQL
ncbi:hypothetical protein ECC02_012044 [Trypanosoma cruzi]|uniref:Uncharacterized protein n=1 Tax=Trypanosoma cruzi TaxID=5693 RepID=A0A7J6XMS6_TRYCR|nr:hypothetical protein ECC02_012044 [Trypanosoma cruzi]